jgi:hypothetical protein
MELDDAEAVPHNAPQEFGTVLKCHQQIVIAEASEADRQAYFRSTQIHFTRQVITPYFQYVVSLVRQPPRISVRPPRGSRLRFVEFAASR